MVGYGEKEKEVVALMGFSGFAREEWRWGD